MASGPLTYTLKNSIINYYYAIYFLQYGEDIRSTHTHVLQEVKDTKTNTKDDINTGANKRRKRTSHVNKENDESQKLMKLKCLNHQNQSL